MSVIFLCATHCCGAELTEAVAARCARCQRLYCGMCYVEGLAFCVTCLEEYAGEWQAGEPHG